MTVVFREATEADIPAVLALLRDDILGAGREEDDPAPYRAAFAAMQAEGTNRVIVGQVGERIVATYQFTVISGLSLRATRRGQLESVRVARDLRGGGIGQALVADAEARAKAAGCGLLQLTMNATRLDARRFYEREGFEGSHIGFKRFL